MLFSKIGKHKSYLTNKNGFTIIEVLVAMAILVLFITAFSALFVQSYTGIMAAGSKNNASYQAQAEVEQRIAEENSDSSGTYTITFGSINITINGGKINVDKTKNGQKSSMLTFIALIPTMTLQPRTTEGKIDEGYSDGLKIDVTGENTHFGAGSTLNIVDNSDMSAAVGSTITYTSTTKAQISLKQGLTSAGGPYLLTIVTGEEQVSAKLTIRPLVRYVSVGDGRKIAVSTNLTKWTEDYWGSDKNLNCIAAYNGIFLAAGNLGKVVYSDNGYNWISQDLDTAGGELQTDFKAIAYGGGTSVAVGTAGTIYMSLENTTGSNKRTYKTPTVNNLNAVTYGGGRFITVGDNGYIAYSNDGSVWTQADSSTVVGLNNLYAVTYGRIDGIDYYLASGAGVMAISQDAVNWYRLDLADYDESTISFNSMVCNNNKIFLAADSRILTIGSVVTEYVKDSNGVATTQISSYEAQGLFQSFIGPVKSLILAPDGYWAIVDSSFFIRSTDGAAWSQAGTFSSSGLNALVVR